VLFCGVLYHVRHPLLALDRVWSVCRGTAIIETQALDHAFFDAGGEMLDLASLDERLVPQALVQFYPDETLYGDGTGTWVPNGAALLALLESACFDVTYGPVVIGQRALAAARRTTRSERLYWRDLDQASVSVEVGRP
jgi:tRNA (mo5U34)-methyltransferase